MNARPPVKAFPGSQISLAVRDCSYSEEIYICQRQCKKATFYLVPCNPPTLADAVGDIVPATRDSCDSIANELGMKRIRASSIAQRLWGKWEFASREALRSAVANSCELRPTPLRRSRTASGKCKPPHRNPAEFDTVCGEMLGALCFPSPSAASQSRTATQPQRARSKPSPL